MISLYKCSCDAERTGQACICPRLFALGRAGKVVIGKRAGVPCVMLLGEPNAVEYKRCPAFAGPSSQLSMFSTEKPHIFVSGDAPTRVPDCRKTGFESSAGVLEIARQGAKGDFEMNGYQVNRVRFHRYRKRTLNRTVEDAARFMKMRESAIACYDEKCNEDKAVAIFPRQRRCFQHEVIMTLWVRYCRKCKS